MTTVVAIGMAAPAITLLLQGAAGYAVRAAPADIAGLALTVIAVLVLLAAGARADSAARPPGRLVHST